MFSLELTHTLLNEVDHLPIQGTALVLRNIDQLFMQLTIQADSEVLVSFHSNTTFQGDVTDFMHAL